MSSAARRLDPIDVPSAVELSTAANWNQTPEDWHRMLQLSAEGCRCIEEAGRVVATATLVHYGTQLGWIGMVLTRPENRRQGLARLLMKDVIASADGRGMRTLKLDATDEGRPLYESLGFVVEQVVERWGRDGGDSVVANREGGGRQSCGESPRISNEMVSRDAAAFGATRRELLEVLTTSGRGKSRKKGYVLSRPGRTARYLGPCVAVNADAARRLIAAQFDDPACRGEAQESSASSNWYWDLLPVNVDAVRCAAGLGFTRRRTLMRMRRGDVITKNDAMVYAIAGFEFG